MTATSSQYAPSKSFFPFFARSFHETLVVPRLKRRSTAHYRPVSQLLLEEADTQPRPIKLSLRDSISLLMAIPDYPLLEVDHQPLKYQEKNKKEHFYKAPPVPSRKGPVNKALIESFELAADLFPKQFYDDSKVSRLENVFMKKRMRQGPCPGEVYMQSYDRVMLEK